MLHQLNINFNLSKYENFKLISILHHIYSAGKVDSYVLIRQRNRDVDCSFEQIVNTAIYPTLHFTIHSSISKTLTNGLLWWGLPLHMEERQDRAPLPCGQCQLQQLWAYQWMLHKLGLHRTITEFLILLDLGSKKNVSWSAKGTFHADKTHSCGVVSVRQHAKWQAVNKARV